MKKLCEIISYVQAWKEIKEKTLCNREIISLFIPKFIKWTHITTLMRKKKEYSRGKAQHHSFNIIVIHLTSRNEKRSNFTASYMV